MDISLLSSDIVSLETMLFLIVSLDKEKIQFKHQKLFYTAHRSYKKCITLELFGRYNLLGTSAAKGRSPLSL